MDHTDGTDRGTGGDGQVPRSARLHHLIAQPQKDLIFTLQCICLCLSILLQYTLIICKEIPTAQRKRWLRPDIKLDLTC